MSEFKLDMSGSALQSALSEAIIQQLGDEGRKALIADALEYLTKQPGKPKYGQEPVPSPVMSSFRDVSWKMCREVVADLFKNDPEIKEKIEGLVRKALELALAKDNDALAATLADAIHSKLFRQED